MRVFIGIKFDEGTRKDIESFLSPFKKISSPVRWTRPENIHLTLKFIGEVPGPRYSQVEESLAGHSYGVESFNLELAGCGKFGRGGDLSIFWIGARPEDVLENLFNQIETALQKASIPREQRPFKPHVTVGRNKKRYNFKPLFNLMEERSGEGISRFDVKAFQVFKSELYSSGPVYSILKEIPLGNA